MKFRAFIIILILGLIPLQISFADELFFKNGDNLKGKFVILKDGKLTFDSETLGPITFKIDEIETMSTDKPVEIHLKSGDVIFVAMGAVDGGFFAPESPEARIYSKSDVKAIYRMKDCGPPPPLENPEQEKKTRRKSSGKMSVDASLESGEEEENLETGVGVELNREIGPNKISGNFSYLYGESMDKIDKIKMQTQDSFCAVGKYDFSLNRKPFGYLTTKYETNRLEETDSKIVTSSGIEYDIIDKPNTNFKIQSSAEWKHENGVEINDPNDVDAKLKWNLKKQFTKNLLLKHELEYVPEGRDLSNLFLSTETQLRSNLTKSLFWDFKISTDFDSTMLSDEEKSNIKYTLGIGWDLF